MSRKKTGLHCRSLYFYSNGNLFVQMSHLANEEDLTKYINKTVTVRIKHAEMYGMCIDTTGSGIILEDWSIDRSRKVMKNEIVINDHVPFMRLFKH